MNRKDKKMARLCWKYSRRVVNAGYLSGTMFKHQSSWMIKAYNDVLDVHCFIVVRGGGALIHVYSNEFKEDPNAFFKGVATNKDQIEKVLHHLTIELWELILPYHIKEWESKVEQPK